MREAAHVRRHRMGAGTPPARTIRQSAASYVDDDSNDDDLAQQLVYQAAVMVLESKAASILHGPGGAEIDRRTKRLAEIDTEPTKIRTAIEVMSALPDFTEDVARLRADLAELDHERSEADPRQAKWQAELRAIHERHALEQSFMCLQAPSFTDPAPAVLS